jgi:orotidine-5'-phosphate decarboxylase
VGATIGETGHDLSAVNGPFLAPGIGAQGATAADLRTVFGAAAHAVLPSTSREVLGQGPSIGGLQSAASRALEACQVVLATA